MGSLFRMDGKLSAPLNLRPFIWAERCVEFYVSIMVLGKAGFQNDMCYHPATLMGILQVFGKIFTFPSD